MLAETLHQLIAEGLPGARVEVTGADGVHLEALVVSETFIGQPTLARHRQVYAILGARMGTEIHALSLQALTPDEYAAQAAI